jgi:copper chaperone CopZ
MEVKINGMSCGHCEGRVKTEFEKLGAVVELVSAGDGKAIVSGVDEASARNAVAAAGYKVVSIS